ncbi:MAG: hypothetical protein KA735_12090 [Burkholderiaceae bacterium]|nr:hypothetical protein [Burkholderiaceae bacterium]
MTEKLKAAAVEKLRQAGAIVENENAINAICRDIAKVTGKVRSRGQAMAKYIEIYVNTPDPDAEVFIPQKATVPQWGKRAEYRPPAHFRDDDIDQMPRPIAMSGPGIGGDNGMGRGR